MIFSKPLIAMDIGSSSVKLVEVTGRGTSRKLIKLGLEMVPDGVVINGEIQDPDALVKTIKRLLKNLDVPMKGRRGDSHFQVVRSF